VSYWPNGQSRDSLATLASLVALRVFAHFLRKSAKFDTFFAHFLGKVYSHFWLLFPKK
jgi:hypothetical protein